MIGSFQNVLVVSDTIENSSFVDIFIWHKKNCDHGRFFRVELTIGRTLCRPLISKWNNSVIRDDNLTGVVTKLNYGPFQQHVTLRKGGGQTKFNCQFFHFWAIVYAYTLSQNVKFRTNIIWNFKSQMGVSEVVRNNVTGIR